MKIYKPSEAKKLIGCPIEYEHISGGPTFGPVEVLGAHGDLLSLVDRSRPDWRYSVLLSVTLIQPLQSISKEDQL
jgi:hypothetical protein